MAIQCIEIGHKPNTMYSTWIVDTDADIANLPTNCGFGSRAIVAENGNLYVLDSQGTWNPMPGNE